MEKKDYSKVNYIYGFFDFTAENYVPNRDGFTGEIRQYDDGRVYMSEESVKQIVRLGVHNNNAYYQKEEQLLIPKMTPIGSEERTKAVKRVFNAISKYNREQGKDKEVDKQDLFRHVFDTTWFGDVNSEKTDKGKEKSIFPSTPRSVGFIVDPFTVSIPQINVEGKSNCFNGDGKEQSGSRIVETMKYGTFVSVFQMNLTNLREQAKESYGFTVEQENEVNERINELVDRFLDGLWVGFASMRSYSAYRKGIEPLYLYTIGLEQDIYNERITNLSDSFKIEEEGDSDKNDIEKINTIIPGYFNKFGTWEKYFNSQELNLI